MAPAVDKPKCAQTKRARKLTGRVSTLTSGDE
jgi:hypothetical protein